MRDHFVERRQYTAAPILDGLFPRAQQSDPGGIGIRIPEDAQDINFPQMCDRHRDGLDRCAHADHDHLPAGAGRVERGVHADFFASAFKGDVDAVVFEVVEEGGGGGGEGEHVRREGLGVVKLARDGERAGGGQDAIDEGGGGARGGGACGGAAAGGVPGAAVVERGAGGRGVQRLRDDVAVRGEAFRDGKVDAALVDVGDGDSRAARLPGHGGGEQADGAGADDQGC